MRTAIDPGGMWLVQSTLESTGRELRGAAAACSSTRGQARGAIGRDNPSVPVELERFLTAHVAALEAFGTAFAALGGDVQTVLETHQALERDLQRSLCLPQLARTP